MDLFSPYALDRIDLRNRIVMAPMTRCRAVEGNVPNPLAITYYSQRASAGLIITEGSQVSPMGVGFIRTPGIHSREQVFGWEKITRQVHNLGGRIFLQLWHVGRVSHPDFLNGKLPVGPSALAIDDEIHTPMGKKRLETPRELETDEIQEVIDQFRIAAINADLAGFDGVEIHGANGYLLDQFLRTGSNVRTDAYGGSLENRARFPVGVAEAVAGAIGADRVGYRISPHFTRHGMSDSDPEKTFTFLAHKLDKAGIGYMHLEEPIGGRMGFVPPENRLARKIRAVYKGTLMLNGGYGAQAGNEVISTGEADLVSFGVPFLANPDLPERFRRGASLNREDPSTFYEGEDKGYTDYPKLGK